MFNKNLLIGIALSFSLSACGGSTTPTGAQEPSMSSSMTSSISPLTAPGSTGGITPINSINPGDAYDQTVQTPAADAAPAEAAADVPTEAPSAETVAEKTPAATDKAPAAATPATGTIPANTTVAEPYNPTTTTKAPAASSTTYSTEGSYKVDQATINRWQATNIASDGSKIYLSAIQTQFPSKGTVLSMDASGGSWADLGKSIVGTLSLGAFGYKMTKTITGLAVDSNGNILVSDAQDQVFSMTTPAFKATPVKVSLSGATDVASAGGNYYIATASGIQKIDSSMGAPTSFGSVSPTGGLGTDSQGNVYAVVGSSIKKLSSSGSATDAVTGLSGAVDVAVDSKGNIFVLQSSSIVWFNDKGVKQGEFGGSDLKSPKALCTDSSGSVFVADAGTSNKDSMVIKFTASSGGGGGESLGGSLNSLDKL